ncbi:hypothetical protein C1645_745849 [Glomus cerebriforme]|uniref:Uncharacterized protein n=1 Tax=Glomus cerebriforme TaxID=658196 RepID=A0A397S0U7_9GLOM|nr:hypothetical protein C1645_745849 [Glomus cerebriforme]
MAQIHSYYITNVNLELRFFSSNMREGELKVTIQEVTTAMINNDDLFVEEKKEEKEEEKKEIFFSNSEIINLDEKNTNNLIMADFLHLDVPDFEEKCNENNINSNISIQSQSVDHGNLNVDFEGLLNEEFEV